MKKILFGLILLMIFSINVSAKDYTMESIYNTYMDNGYVILQSGDTFTGSPYYTSKPIFVDGEKVSDDSISYTFDKTVIFAYRSIRTGEGFNFYTFDEDADIYYYELKRSEGKLLKTGDYFVLNSEEDFTLLKELYPEFAENTWSSGFRIFIHDKDNDLLQRYEDDEFSGYILLKIPQYEDKDTYWKISVLNDGYYNYPSAHLTPFDYKDPEFKLTCKDSSIAYGKSTSCEVSVVSDSKISDVSFDLSSPNFKVLSTSFPDDIKKVNGDKEYNLKIDDNHTWNNKGEILMRFVVEGVKNVSYTDDIKLRGISYTDEYVTSYYGDVKSTLEIVPINNPKTLYNYLIILLPILLLIGAFTINKVYNTKRN